MLVVGGNPLSWCRFSLFLGQSPVLMRLFAPIGGTDRILPPLARLDPGGRREIFGATIPPCQPRIMISTPARLPTWVIRGP